MSNRMTFIFWVSAFVAAPVSAETLHLVCNGGGAANKPTASNVYTQNSDGHYGSAQVYGQRSQGFEGQVDVEIEGDTGRIRMPRAMLPPIHGGNGGWFKINNLKVSESQIIGNAGVNFINSPKVRIDRLTGNLTVSGKAGDFNGSCDSYDPTKVQKRF